MEDDDKRLTVMGIDNGVTIGWSWFSLDQATILDHSDSALSLSRKLRSGERGCGEITGEGRRSGRAPSSPWVEWDNASMELLLDQIRKVWVEAEVDEEKDVFVLAVEDFVLRTSDSARHTISPVRLNAMLEWELRNSGIQIVKHSASDAKNSVTDARLKAWGLYDWCTKGFQGREHARDATRHAVLTTRKWMASRHFRAGLVTGLVPVREP